MPHLGRTPSPEPSRDGVPAPPDEPAESLPSGFLPPNEVLGRYVVLYRLGTGGMGIVYAAYDPKLDLEVPSELFPADARKHLQPGFRFVAEHPEKEGEQVMFTVHQVVGDKVRVSGNHPLAGQTLLFNVEIVSVRAATKDELDHGHAHGPGGHHH